jgi:uncharacterized protein YrrD
MTRFADVDGKPVLSRDSAEELGHVTGVAIALDPPRVTSLVVRSGRKTGVVPRERVASFGPDAVVVGSDDAWREPSTDDDEGAAGGRSVPVGTRVLTDAGNELGTVSDAEFDPGNGTVVAVFAQDVPIDAQRLRGLGSYALVVRADADLEMRH